MALLWFIVAGVLAAPVVAMALPAAAWPGVALGGSVLFAPRATRHIAAAWLALAWGLCSLERRLDSRIDVPPGTEAVVTGTVISLPVRRDDMLQFRVRAEGLAGARPGRPTRLLVRWYRDAPDVRVGERWRVHLKLRPARGRVNFTGPDLERWYLVQGIDALGTVTGEGGERLGVARGHAPERMRQAVRDRLTLLLAEHTHAPLVLALAIADRGSIRPELRRSLAVTGTGHLLAISGLHVGLVAWFGYWLARAMACPLRGRLVPASGHVIAVVAGAGAAGFYALLAGFGTSTRRALIMLSVFAACALLRRSPPPFHAWFLAAALVLLIDPLAPLEAGFWLSFVAVAALILVFAPRVPVPGRLASLVWAQAAITLAMAPVTAYWFQQASVAGMAVNLAAIPWVSFITLPLILAGLVLLPLHAPLAELALQMAADSGAWIGRIIDLSAQHLDLFAPPLAPPGPAGLALALLGAGMLLLPRGLPVRWLGLLLYLPALLPPDPGLRPGALRLELLDVGQGLGVLVQTRGNLLLYDTGPGQPGRWDLVGSVVRPAVAGVGRGVPDRAVISHGDLDHAGGLDSLHNWLSPGAFLGNLPRPQAGVAPCHSGTAWTWDDVHFRVLHPGPYLPYLGNDSSCVLAIEAPGGSILLPGDIGAAVEQRLAGRAGGGYAVLVAPHHGSRTSSTARFLAWARPGYVLIPAGNGNRFGFPHAEVLQRIRQQGARAWSTSDCGALRIEVHPDGRIEAGSARRTRSAPWRWKAAGGCP